MSNKFEFVVHPGKILSKSLKAINMSQRELAEKTGLNKTVINELIKGKRRFTLHVASKLVPIFEMPASFWSNLQNNYDETQMRLTRLKELEGE